MSKDEIAALRKHAAWLRISADASDMGRKPNPSCLNRMSAAAMDKAADTIERLQAERDKAVEALRDLLRAYIVEVGGTTVADRFPAVTDARATLQSVEPNHV